MFQNAARPLSGNLRPDLLTYLTHVSLVLRLPREMHLARSSSNVPRLPSFLKLLQNHRVLLTFDKVRLPRKTTSERPKVLRTPQFFTLLTSKCAARYNGAHFFDIATSKSAPKLRCFTHFHLEMRFAPQRRALFRHLNFQKCSEREVHLAFSLANALRATTACTFSWRAIYFWIFFAAGFGFFWGFLVLCFSASLLFCFSAFLLLCFLLSLLLCFSCVPAFLLLAFPASLLFCFSVFPASLLLYFCAFLLLLFYFFFSSVMCFCCSTSCSFASLLPVFTASLFFIFFCFILFCLYPK